MCGSNSVSKGFGASVLSGSEDLVDEIVSIRLCIAPLESVRVFCLQGFKAFSERFYVLVTF